nr:MAG TPA_asm: hypothetical protein [Caudoviricetes sp.]
MTPLLFICPANRRKTGIKKKSGLISRLTGYEIK